MRYVAVHHGALHVFSGWRKGLGMFLDPACWEDPAAWHAYLTPLHKAHWGPDREDDGTGEIVFAHFDRRVLLSTATYSCPHSFLVGGRRADDDPLHKAAAALVMRPERWRDLSLECHLNTRALAGQDVLVAMAGGLPVAGPATPEGWQTLRFPLSSLLSALGCVHLDARKAPKMGARLLALQSPPDAYLARLLRRAGGLGSPAPRALAVMGDALAALSEKVGGRVSKPLRVGVFDRLQYTPDGWQVHASMTQRAKTWAAIRELARESGLPGPRAMLSDGSAAPTKADVCRRRSAARGR